MAVNIRKIDRQLGKLLVNERYLSQEELDKSVDEAISSGKNLGDLLVKKNVITQEQLALALSRQHGIPYFSLHDYEIDKEVIGAITEEQARRFQIIPVDKTGNTLLVAISDPNDILRLDDVKLHIKMDIKPLLSLQSDIEEAIEKYYGDSSDALGEIYKDIDTEDVEVVEVQEDTGEDGDTDDAPVIKLVNAIVSEAIRTRTSDIHLEPEEHSFRLRYRIDGVLHEMPAPPKRLQNAIISRLKIMSELDISERRKPQDGRFKMRSGNKVVDFRVSVLPTVHGEKIVMRLLDSSNLMLDMKMLGFEPEQLAAFEKAIKRPFGMILVTGPTGSGKSTTLYSALSKINDPEKNIVTVEDPVEFQLKGINQVMARAEVGLSFAAGLKSILRQDPDIVMIGEIRDYETGEIAVKAALTGHLVLSTLHTNDAPSTPVRLTNMGIEPFLVTASLILVVAQRLARRVCPQCKEPYTPKAEILERLEIKPKQGQKIQFYEGRGCNNCNGTGYKGRLALYEVMELTDEIQEGIIRGLPSNELKKVARECGMLTLRDSGIRKLLAGMTTVKEVFSNTFEN